MLGYGMDGKLEFKGGLHEKEYRLFLQDFQRGQIG